MSEERYLRNMTLLSPEENDRLKTFRVCVIGCGGLGGYNIEMLGRLGCWPDHRSGWRSF